MKPSTLATLLVFVLAAVMQDVWRANNLAAQAQIRQEETAVAAGTSTPGVVSSVSNYLDASSGQRVHVAFCSSCGFGNKYIELKSAIENSVPGIEVSGSTYPLPLWKTAVSWLLWLAAPLIYFGHETFFAATNLPMPEIVKKIKGYGYQAAMAGFYLGTMLSSRFTNSGAFEVAFDGALLFSRLATGAFPVPADIAGLVKEGLAAGGHA